MTEHKGNLGTFSLQISLTTVEIYVVPNYVFSSETEVPAYVQRVNQINYIFLTFEIWKDMGEKGLWHHLPKCIL